MYIPGWVIFVLLVASGLIMGGYIGGASKGDYDFFSPLIGLAIWAVTIVGAICFLIGKYLF